ncbi:hypothetical protein SOV_34640 [Sporomusa ovata DSM 2662]|uniref:Uncharacterized protein n=1 Tax=Sporomusa ovata TaxID=2378 RepID=A0A0U1L625_9FIRM|nr:hypothetical protein [Sporomusa ovata]EQB24612.1 hypothetical protein SOV_6c00260 [Sporomusa ovata DSM 2662]CQR74965.1 hypothetical protein SpAn4DRAFT_4329 [Sporomusa ovata]
MTGPVYLTIGGKERKLRYDINAAADMEELMGGKSLLYVLKQPDGRRFLRHPHLAMGWPKTCRKRTNPAAGRPHDARVHGVRWQRRKPCG